MNSQIWKIKDKKLNNTNLFLYSEFIKKKYKIEIENDFNKVWKWSVENPRYFWIIKAYRDAYSYETQGLPYLKWEEYADTEESRDELIADARKSNLRCAVIKRIDMRTYA